MSTQVITDADIQALIDGELTPARLEIVLTAIENDDMLRQRYDALSHQKNLLLRWWAEEQHKLS